MNLDKKSVSLLTSPNCQNSLKVCSLLISLIISEHFNLQLFLRDGLTSLAFINFFVLAV